MWTLHRSNMSSYIMRWHSRSDADPKEDALIELPAESASGATRDCVVVSVAEEAPRYRAEDPVDEA
jgi:hypothetical protein